MPLSNAALVFPVAALGSFATTIVTALEKLLATLPPFAMMWSDMPASRMPVNSTTCPSRPPGNAPAPAAAFPAGLALPDPASEAFDVRAFLALGFSSSSSSSPSSSSSSSSSAALRLLPAFAPPFEAAGFFLPPPELPSAIQPSISF